MKTTFYSLKIQKNINYLIVAIIFLFTNSKIQAQCGCAGTNYGLINTSGWIVGNSATQGAVYGGERVTISNTVAGATYRISTCGASYDTQLSIYTTGCVYVGYNDDNGPACAGSRASLDIVSPGGDLFAKLNQYNCATNSTNTNVTVTLLSLPAAPLPRCINLTANPQWVNIGDLDVSGNQITVEALVYYTGGVNILSKHTDPSNVNYLLRTGTFELTTTNGFYLMSNPYAGSMLPNTWYHVAGTYDGSFIRYYVNGCLIIEQPATGNLITNNLAASIGSQSTTPEQYYGQIDEVRIWNTARTQAQIAANMLTLPSPTTQPNLLGYYKMDNSVVNVQGNAAFNGSWVGTPAYVAESASIPMFTLNDVNPTNSTCNAANNGAINIQASGSSLQYSIDGTTWQASNNFTGLTPGTYTTYVRSLEGCIIPSANVVVGQNNVPPVPIVSASNPNFCAPGTTNLNSTGLAPSGQVFQGNGTNAVVEVIQDVPETNFTIEMWVKTAAANTGIFSVSSLPFGSNGHDRHLYLAGGQLWVRVWTGAGWNTGHTLNDNQWHHIALTTQTGVGQKVYVDGALIATFGYDVSDFNWQDRFYIGYSNDAGANAFLTGQIDNVRYWSTVRTQAEIIANMNLETPLSSAGLVSNLPLNGNATALVGPNGTATNPTWSLPAYYTYTWSTGPNLPAPSINEQQTTGSITTGGSYNYYVTAASPLCTSALSVAVPVIVDSPSTAPSSISGTGAICVGNSSTLTQVGGALGGSASYNWYTGSCGGTLVGTGPSITVSPTSTTTYYVGATANGTCPATVCANGAVTLPATGTNLSLNNESASCVVNQAGWVHFYHSSGRLIASINSGGQNLGNVTVTSYVDGAPASVPACDFPLNADYTTAYMQRHWVVTPQFQPATPVEVKLPFSNAEFSNLVGVANTNPNGNDDLLLPDDLKLTKYSGPLNVNDDAVDNCPSNGGSGGATIHTQTNTGLTTLYSAVTGAQYTDYTVPSFSELWLHGSLLNSPLPVELVSLAAVCEENGNDVKVRWTTASEQNSSHFTVERSVDGINWLVLGTVNAAGTSTSNLNYELIDFDTRGYSVIYYRLNQFDNNGESKAYGPISAECLSEQLDFEVFPNPAGTDVTVLLHGEHQEGETSIHITDINGKEVKTILYSEQVGKLISVDLRNLEQGVYIVRLVNGEENNQFVRLVKQ
jgi:hypothetical protein